MNLRSQISQAGYIVEMLRQRNRVQICSRVDLISKTRKLPGLYWIETNMPTTDITNAVKQHFNKVKVVRKTKPDGIGFTTPINGCQIIYSGTENDLQKRLLEHLFNEGNAGTTKMLIKIDSDPFSQYDWFISCVHIKDYPSRYAIEAWWRLNVGWPPFCIR